MLGSDQRRQAEQPTEKIAAMLQLLLAAPTKLSALIEECQLHLERSWALSKEIAWDSYGDSLMAGTEKYLPTDSRAQLGAQNGVVTLVVVGATLIIGIVVYASISEAAPSNHSMTDTQNAVDSTVAGSFELGAIIPLVVVAVVILGLLGMFGVGGGGGGRR